MLHSVPVEPGPGPDPSGDARPEALLVCFSHLRWDFVWQRPQHLLVRAAATFRVVFVEEPVFAEAERPQLDWSDREGGIRVAVPVLPHGLSPEETIGAQRDLIGAMLAAEPAGPRLFWYYTPMAMAFSADLPADIRVYDNMDELSAFRGASPEMLENEAALFRTADLVFTGGRSLYEAKRGRHPSVHAFPSSIDATHFSAARRADRRDPADQADIPTPRIGFFGVIDERMDTALVDALAAARPDWHFVMIGPVVKIDPADLPRRANIHWLGPKSYGELPAYLGGWTLGLMPFALNEATRFISPTKTPEFLAAGLPVVSTPIADVVRPYGEAGLVAIADGPEAVAAALGTLIATDRAAWRAAADRHLTTQSWDRTWAAMEGLIRQAAPGLFAPSDAPALQAAE